MPSVATLRSCAIYNLHTHHLANTRAAAGPAVVSGCVCPGICTPLGVGAAGSVGGWWVGAALMSNGRSPLTGCVISRKRRTTNNSCRQSCTHESVTRCAPIVTHSASNARRPRSIRNHARLHSVRGDNVVACCQRARTANRTLSTERALNEFILLERGGRVWVRLRRRCGCKFVITLVSHSSQLVVLHTTEQTQ